MAEASNNVCPNHPDTPAVARCATCGKPVCAKCVVNRNGYQYCSTKCAAMAESTKGNVDTVLTAKKRTDSKSKVRTIIILIVLVAAVAAGYFFYQRNRNDVKRFIRKTENQVTTGAKNTKKSIDKGIPKSSKYKRDRENLVK